MQYSYSNIGQRLPAFGMRFSSFFSLSSKFCKRGRFQDATSVAGKNICLYLRFQVNSESKFALLIKREPLRGTYRGPVGHGIA